METDKKEEGRKALKLPVWMCILLYIMAFLICMGVFATLAQVIQPMVFGAETRHPGVWGYILLEASMLLAVLVATMIFLRIERRPFSDIGLTFKGHLKGLWYGLLTAVMLYFIGFGLSLVLGEVEVTGFHLDSLYIIEAFFFFVLVALTEEIMMRGYILGRLLEARLNKFVSLLISSVLFAIFHLLNPNVAFLPMLNLVLAGMLLGASFLYVRNLCFPLSLHLFWNWIQGPILGYQVSGNTLGPSLLKLRLPEENILNGGAFGFEGSLICTVLMIVFTVLIIWWGEKREVISLVAHRSC